MPLLIIPVLVAAMALAALVDILTGDELHVRYIPKIAWIAVVVLLPLVGTVLWFAVGAERGVPDLSSPDDVRTLREAVHGPR